jgi:hypothetical protein
MLKIAVFIFAVGMLVSPSLVFADGPISLGLFTPVQIVEETESVTAFRFSLIYGKNVNMQGFDLSLVGMNTGDVSGVAFTAVGIVDGNFTGWQNSWLVAITEGNMQGLQWAAYTKSGLGSSGVQLGLLNMSDDFSGLQLGIVNITEVMRSGLQIGLVNIIKSKEKLKFFTLVNWSF